MIPVKMAAIPFKTLSKSYAIRQRKLMRLKLKDMPQIFLFLLILYYIKSKLTL